MLTFHDGDEIKFKVGDRVKFKVGDDAPSQTTSGRVHRGNVHVFFPPNVLQLRERRCHTTYFLEDIQVISIKRDSDQSAESAIKGCGHFDFDILDADRGNSQCIMTDDAGDIIPQCSYLKRLIAALKWYSLLDVSKDSHQDSLMRLLSTRFHHLLEDFHHLHRAHDHQIQKVHSIPNSKGKITSFQTIVCPLSRYHSTSSKPKCSQSAKRINVL